MRNPFQRFHWLGIPWLAFGLIGFSLLGFMFPIAEGRTLHSPLERRLHQQADLDPDLQRLLDEWPSVLEWYLQEGAIGGADQEALITSLVTTLQTVYEPYLPQPGEVPLDRPPTLESAEIIATPDPPVTTSTLRIVPHGWQDEDGDAEGYFYRWFNQQGVIEGAESDTLDSRFFQRGDTIFAAVVPFDGTLPGTVAMTPSVTIRNTPPQFSTLQLQITPDPAHPREESTIRAIPGGWNDPDGDPAGYRYEWYNQAGRLKGTLSQSDEAALAIQGVSTLSLEVPFPIIKGQEITLQMRGVQKGSVQLISPTGQILGPFDLPEHAGSRAEDELPLTLEEVGEYQVQETFQLVVASTSMLIPFESVLQHRFTWSYTNKEPGERIYRYATTIRNLQVHADGKIQTSLEVADPGAELEITFVIQETLQPQTLLEQDVEYGADFEKTSSVATPDVPIAGQEVTGAFFNKGDELYVIVTANDGLEDGNALESERVVIQNTPPAIASVAIVATPEPPRVESTLTAQVEGWQDADDDPPQIRYQWFNQSGPIAGATGESLTENFRKGDVIRVEATPFDGTDMGPPVQSPPVTIQNTPPSKPKVAVKPSNPGDGDDLTWEFTVPSEDPDGDTLTYQVRWYIGSKEQEDLAGQDTVPASRTQPGERWRVSVTVSDGETTLSPVSSPFVRIVQGNTPPSIEAVHIFPVPAYAGDVLTAQVEGWQDAEGAPQQIAYRWEVWARGAWQLIGTEPTLNTAGQPNDAQIRVTATPRDSQSTGEPRSDQIQLGGVIRNAEDTVRVVIPPGSLKTSQVRLALHPFQEGVATILANSRGYYQVQGNLWQIAVEAGAANLAEALDRVPVDVTLCNPGDATQVLFVEGSRLQEVNSTLEGDCLSGTVMADQIWGFGTSDAPERPWDVNQDGTVDILDLVIVGASFGETLEAAQDPNPDVTRDWVVDILDLVAIGSHFGEKTAVAAPSLAKWGSVGTVRLENPRIEGNTLSLDVWVDSEEPLVGYLVQFQGDVSLALLPPSQMTGIYHLPARQASGTLSAVKLAGSQPWRGKFQIGTVRLPYARATQLEIARAEGVTPAWQRRVLRAERFDLKQLFPDQTRLLGNYPNPFNPETWIAFQLHQSSPVTITLYDALGRTIRRLDLGTLPPGYYRTQERAAHWDGRNQAGEPVASGVYFITLHTRDGVDVKRMTLLK